MSLLRAVDLEIFVCAAFVVTTVTFGKLLACKRVLRSAVDVYCGSRDGQLSDTENYELSHVYHESPLALLYENTIP